MPQHVLTLMLTSLLVIACPAIADDAFYDLPAPGQRIDIGGYKLHLLCEGSGQPAVIFESGLGDWSSHWASVQQRLRADTQVCSYDRAGYGWSDPGPRPRDSSRAVDELHTLLGKAGITPPYLLVGHSLGGIHVRLFASTYPDEVSGLLLVDASHPASLPYRRNEDGSTANTAMTTGNQLMRVAPLESEEMHLPAEIQAAIGNPLLHTKSVVTGRAEFRALGQSVAALQNAPPMPDLPLIVLSRGLRAWPDGAIGDAQELAWETQQNELSKLSTHGTRRIALHSGHHIQLDEPDMVADAVRELLREIR